MAWFLEGFDTADLNRGKDRVPEKSPLTVCRCQPIALATSSTVAPSARCSIAITASCFDGGFVSDAVWISIPVHLFGGLALLVSFYSRWAAALLALVCLGTAFGVHLPAGDQNNMIHFYKNLVMTGGFLYVIAFGPGGREAA